VGGLPGAIEEASFSSFTLNFPAREHEIYLSSSDPRQILESAWLLSRTNALTIMSETQETAIGLYSKL
jgi:hypothetical protein